MARKWSKHEDRILVEAVLKHIEDGSTQLAAFAETGERLGRSPEACGFRWNNVLRKKYEASLQIAQEQARSVRTRSKLRLEDGWDEKEIPRLVNWMIRYLRWWRDRWAARECERKELKEKIRRKEEVIRQLKQENERLQRERVSGTMFGMETNGNLVRVEGR